VLGGFERPVDQKGQSGKDKQKRVRSGTDHHGALAEDIEARANWVGFGTVWHP